MAVKLREALGFTIHQHLLWSSGNRMNDELNSCRTIANGIKVIIPPEFETRK